jgi:hypothetical protein
MQRAAGKRKTRTLIPIKFFSTNQELGEVIKKILTLTFLLLSYYCYTGGTL